MPKGIKGFQKGHKINLGKHYSPETEFKVGENTKENNHNWKGCKYIDSTGYVRIRTKTGNRYLLEHRVVWEKHFGKLKEGYIVHHLNGDKKDNCIENLIAVLRKEHSFMTITDPFKKRIKELEKMIKDLKKIIKEEKKNECNNKNCE